MLDQGYALSQAIEFLQIQLSNRCREHLENSIRLLKEGDSVYELFRDMNFHHDVLGYLYFAEKHGEISFALREGSSILQRKIEYQEKLQKLIRYPVFLFLFVIIMFVVIEQMLLPQFEGMYSSMNSGKSSLYLTVIFNFFTYSKVFGLFLLFLAILLFLYYKFYYQHLTASSQAVIKLKIPFFNTFWMLWNSHFFSVQLSNLLKGGLSILEALALFEQQNHSRFFQEEAVVIKERLVSGDRLHDVINERPFYEKELSFIILHGQNHGALEVELFHYSQYVVQRIEEKTTKGLTVMQPLLLTVVGVMIVFMYMAMLLPMFNLIESI
ncbi:competence-related pilin export protein ComGB [Litchfieldia salsa]|uniref:Competence-related pilin export protein ComGB n=1 Tax=Litchfieldia salsa TaxID=930152 RepID=A0A1H0VDA7_9BACI|nr:competence-related pilin export protein ComGB [Litchfieldia salsa]